VGDDELLARAEEALTQIKVNQGLSEDHEAVLAALRIRLKGSAGRSLEEMMEAADDPKPDLAKRLAEAERAPERSLDDLLAGDQEPKPDWPA
jgi:Arc/MetJ family transcription regulator